MPDDGKIHYHMTDAMRERLRNATLVALKFPGGIEAVTEHPEALHLFAHMMKDEAKWPLVRKKLVSIHGEVRVARVEKLAAAECPGKGCVREGWRFVER